MIWITSYAPSLLVCKLSQWPRADEQAVAVKQLVADGYLTRQTPVLVDFRRVSLIPSGIGADEIATALFSGSEGPYRAAFVVDTVEQATFLNLVQRLVPSVEICSFTNEKEAMAWLLPFVRFPLSFFVDLTSPSE